MRRHGFLTSAAMLAALAFPGAASAINLVNNPDFSAPRRDLPPLPPGVPRTGLPTTDTTSTNPALLGGVAAAEAWLIWTGAPGGRVWTRLEPSELFPGGRMLHVRGYEVDQVFAPTHTGTAHGYICALVKVVAGRVGVGGGDQGNSGPGETVGPGDWVRIRGREQSSPVNQVAIFGLGADAEFYVQSVQLSPEPIACERTVSIPRFQRPPAYVKPDPYPWTQHPEQGRVVQPSGNPAQGANPNGYFENMAPGGRPVPRGSQPAQGQDHDEGHDHGGGKMQPSNIPIQQQQPATQH